MPYIIYGGLKYNKIRNALYCKKCKDTIESINIHDFKFCSCGSVGIDGGISEGATILGSLLDMEDRSMYCAEISENKYKLWLPCHVIEENFNYNKIFKIII